MNHSEEDLDAAYGRVFARPDFATLRKMLTRDILTLEEIDERIARMRKRWGQIQD